MAEFCNVCAAKMGFEPDFDIHKEFDKTSIGFYHTVLCEGCSLCAIGNLDGKLMLAPITGGAWETEEQYYEKRGV